MPGQLNLMTAGRGIARAEEATGQFVGTMQGIQLWVAQPETTRGDESTFEHHAELSQVDLGGGAATVLVGEWNGVTSPARKDSEVIGVELVITQPTTIPLLRGFEYALIVLEGSIGVDAQPLSPGKLGYLGLDRDELRIDVREASRVMLIGGEPFESPILMWWNSVARSREEVDAAYASWVSQDERFGRVSSRLTVNPGEAPFWRTE